MLLGPVHGPTPGPILGPGTAGGGEESGLVIVLVGHGLDSGAGAFTLATTGTLPAPLETATGYYAIAVDADHLQLAASRAAALAATAIGLTDAGTGTHTLVTGAGYLSDQATEPPVALVFAEPVLSVEFADGFLDFDGFHGLWYGDGPVRFTTTGTLPSGLSLATNYWVGAAAATSVYLYATQGDAAADINRIEMFDAGTGTLTMTAQAGAQHFEPVTLEDSTFTVELL